MAQVVQMTPARRIHLQYRSANGHDCLRVAWHLGGGSTAGGGAAANPGGGCDAPPASQGVLARGQLQHRHVLAWLAKVLARLRRPLIVVEPPELRDELRVLSHHAARLTERAA